MCESPESESEFGDVKKDVIEGKGTVGKRKERTEKKVSRGIKELRTEKKVSRGIKELRTILSKESNGSGRRKRMKI